jgi:hypothetical protein
VKLCGRELQPPNFGQEEDVVIILTFSPPRPLVVWCFFSRFKTTFVTFLTFSGYLVPLLGGSKFDILNLFFKKCPASAAP